MEGRDPVCPCPKPHSLDPEHLSKIAQTLLALPFHN